MRMNKQEKLINNLTCFTMLTHLCQHCTPQFTWKVLMHNITMISSTSLATIFKCTPLASHFKLVSCVPCLFVCAQEINRKIF